MRYPEFLKKNGTIGFLAPSFGCATEPYKSGFIRAQEIWKGQGYELLFGKNCYEAAGTGISNTPKKCGEEIMEMFASKAQALISCGGGELMCETLPYVDFEKLAAEEPRWFMGYSDNTNLTYLLATLTDTASVYGPCAAAFGMEPWHASLKDAMELLHGKRTRVGSYGFWERESRKDEEHPYEPYALTEPLQIKRYLGGKEVPEKERLQGRGRLLGGCMDCLVNLTGTKFDRTAAFVEKYRKDGILWFLEACDLNVFAIRRAMWQMEQAGWFSHVSGFLIGRPANGETVMNLDAYEAVLAVAGKYQVPVWMDVDLGHRPPMMPLITGSLAEVDSVGNTLEIIQQLVQ